MISIKLQSNFIEITLRHGCSPVNLLHIFRTPFPRNASGELLLIWLGASQALNLKVQIEDFTSQRKPKFGQILCIVCICNFGLIFICCFMKLKWIWRKVIFWKVLAHSCPVPIICLIRDKSRSNVFHFSLKWLKKKVKKKYYELYEILFPWLLN